jgi:hypothetical protein
MAKRDKKTPPPTKGPQGSEVAEEAFNQAFAPSSVSAAKEAAEKAAGAGASAGGAPKVDPEGFGMRLKRAEQTGEKWLGKGKKLVGGMSRGQKALGLLTLGTMALPYAGQMWNGIKSDWNVGSKFGDGVTGEEEALQWQKQVQAVELARQRREAKIQKLAAINAARIQQYAPHLAAKLLTGRDLPRQGILIGGEGGRQDVLQQAARDMAEGKYGGIGEREYAARQDLSAQQANMMALPPGG